VLVVELTELGINGHTNYNYMFVSLHFSLGYDNALINGTEVMKKVLNVYVILVVKVLINISYFLFFRVFKCCHIGPSIEEMCATIFLHIDNALINGTTVVAVNTLKKTANMRLVV
jgi:hypothetical protein